MLYFTLVRCTYIVVWVGATTNVDTADVPLVLRMVAGDAAMWMSAFSA